MKKNKKLSTKPLEATQLCDVPKIDGFFFKHKRKYINKLVGALSLDNTMRKLYRLIELSVLFSIYCLMRELISHAAFILLHTRGEQGEMGGLLLTQCNYINNSM